MEIQDRVIPSLGAGQVLDRMAARVLCHTDIHAVHFDLPVQPAA